MEHSHPIPPQFQEYAWALGLLSLPLLHFGLGEPNHPYQVVLGALTVAMAFHRGWLVFPKSTALRLVSFLVNIAVLTYLFKLLIGSGVRHPLAWIQAPTLASVPMEGRLLSFVPSVSLQWEPTFLAGLSIDFTAIQTFLLILTLLATLFQFHPLPSITALLLIVVSIPAFAGFHWDWVFPALIATGIGFYVQRPNAVSKPV